MLQQTQVKTVIPYYERWMRRLPTIEKVAKARPETILKLWEGLGYYSRARNLQLAAQTIVKDHQGRFPCDFDEVLHLPGIGRYTAGAICSIAFDQPTPILDGNVARVLARIYTIPGDPRKKPTNEVLWRIAKQLVTEASKTKGNGRTSEAHPCSELNQALMEVGALICKPKNPRCEVCPVVELCNAARQGVAETYPRFTARPKPTQRRFIAVALSRRKRFLVRQRPKGMVNATLWEFPNLEIPMTDGDLTQVTKGLFGQVIRPLHPVCEIKHSITRFRITLKTFRGELKGPLKLRGHGAWLTLSQMRRLPFASAHRQILERLHSFCIDSKRTRPCSASTSSSNLDVNQYTRRNVERRGGQRDLSQPAR